MSPSSSIKVRAKLLFWIITQFPVIWEANFDESFFDVSSVFKSYLMSPSYPTSGFLVHFQHIFVTPPPSKITTFSIPVKRHPLGIRFNVPLKFSTCIRCLLLTYLLIFFLVFLYLIRLKACQNVQESSLHLLQKKTPNYIQTMAFLRSS